MSGFPPVPAARSRSEDAVAACDHATPDEAIDFSGSAPWHSPPRPEQWRGSPAAAAESVPVTAATLGARLAELSFADHALFLPDAGAADRVMLDLVQLHHRRSGRPKRRRMLVCGTAMEDRARMLAAAAADPRDITLVPADDPGAVRAAIDGETAALFLTPVVMDAAFAIRPGHLLADARDAADEYGLPLVFDETAGGLGRSGMMWAHEWSGVTPDLMLCNDIAGGALAALLATARLARALPAARPAPDPHALAHAAAWLEAVLPPGFEARIQDLAWRLEDRLAAARHRRRDLFTAAVGLGLMQGLVLTGDAAALAAALAQHGLALRPIGPVLAILPPRDVGAQEIDAAMDRLDAVLAGWDAGQP